MEDIYKIEIWQYHSKVDEYISNDVKEVLNWYNEEWYLMYKAGFCCFYLYKNDVKLTFDEEYKLGFGKQEEE